MKLGKFLLSAVAVAGLLLTAAVAAEKNQGEFTLASPAQISSQTIKAGDYRVQWEGTGPSVQVKILKGAKVVATSTANLVPQTTPVHSDQVVVKVQDNGTRSLQQIDFARRKLSLVFSDTQPSSGQ